MDATALVFLYRTGIVNGRWRGSSLLLGMESVSQWCSARYEQPPLPLYLLGTPIRTDVSPTFVSSTDWVESDPSGLTEDEPFLRSADLSHCMQLRRLQPQLMLDLKDDLANIHLPVFLSAVRGEPPQKLCCKILLEATTIEHIPDVSEFVANELRLTDEGILSPFETMDLRQPTNLPLPVDTWMPAVIATGPHDSLATYRILKRDHETAVVELYVVDPKLTITGHSVLYSKSYKSGNVARIGRVLDDQLGLQTFADK